LKLNLCVLFCAVCTCVYHDASAQVLESVGSRALGMGGAFVAVASDSSATWWNPAGLADGPFVDMAWARALTEVPREVPARRDRTAWFALGTPPFGISYYRLRITDIRLIDPTGTEGGSREARQAEMPVRSWSASQFGATLVQTLVPGIHAGATVKLVRGTFRHALEPAGDSAAELLERGESLEGGDVQNRFDADLGILAVAGAVRLGAVMRNVRQTEFGNAGSTRLRASRSGGQAGPGLRTFVLPRQVRLGAALDAEKAGGVPLMIAVDADLRSYETATGRRRVVAIGAEQWVMGRRLGLRGGGRLNTTGNRTGSATAGVSVGMRSGFFLDGHLVRGGSEDDRGWGVAARVSF
jgi:hypothetical protein